MAVARLRSVAAAARLQPSLAGGVEGRRYLGTAAAAEVAEVAGPGGARWEPMGAREYYDYRRAIYGDITHKAILVDAAGTLLAPTEPMAQVYRAIGEKYGVKYSEDEILMRYRQAYAQPWGRSRLRYVDDGRPFWQYIVSSSTGCSDLQYFEELYHYYTTEKAWQLCDPDAKYVFEALRRAGVRTAVVSNFDTRLRPLLQALKCDNWFDAVAVSAEVAAEKPNPTIFLKACELLGVNLKRLCILVMTVGMIYGEQGMQAAMPGFGAVMFTPLRRSRKGSELTWVWATLCDPLCASPRS